MPSFPQSVDGTLLLVVPTFNNASTIESVLQQLSSLGIAMLVVNDGSTDSSAELLTRFPTVTTRHHECNMGKGAALKTACRYAMERGYSAMISCDADGQFGVDDVRVLVESFAAHPQEIVIGCRRFDDPAAGDVPGGSRFGRRFSNFWVCVESGVALDDTQSGLRLYPLRDPSYFLAAACQRYDFEIEVLVRALWQGIKVRSVSVGVHYPERLRRVSHFRPFVDNLRLSLLHTRLTLTRLFSLFGSPRGERRGARFMWLLHRLIGRHLCYLIGVFPLFFYFVTGNSARQGIVALQQKLRAPRGPLWLRCFEHYVYFAISLIDRLTMASFSHQGGSAFEIETEGLQMIKQIAPGSILIGAHYGDWLICGAALAAHSNHRLKIVMDTRLTPQFQSLMAGPQQNRVEILDGSAGGLALVLGLREAVAEGSLVCLMGDRLDAKGEGIQTEFLGSLATLPKAPFALARALGGDIFFFTSTKSAPLPDAPYRITFHKLADAGKKASSAEWLAHAYSRQLEACVRARPCHWFNFYDFWRCRCPTRV